MRKAQSVFRVTGLSAAAFVLAITGVVLPVPLASAKPYDCLFTVNLVPVGADGLNAGASVYCPRPEHLSVAVLIIRDDGWGGGRIVAKGQGHSRGRQGWTHAHANEPCSDVQTNRKYRATGVLYDTTYKYPIDVKDFTTSSYTGHC
jgi:hypothetical protein